MDVEYSPEAPKVLIESYENINGLGTIFGALLVYPEKLLSLIENSKQNNYLWVKLKPFIENNKNFRHEDFAYSSLYQTIEVAFAGISSWESYTKRERKERCIDIAKKARELAKLLKRTPFDDALLAEFDHPGYYRFVLEKFTAGQKEHLKSMMNFGHITSSVDERVKLGEVTNEHQEILNNIGLVAPSFSESLLGMALKADDRSKNVDEIVNRRGDSPQRVYFIRRVSDWFNWYCNDPLHTYTALLVNIVFDEPLPIGPQEVRNALKDHIHREPPATTNKLAEASRQKRFKKY